MTNIREIIQTYKDLCSAYDKKISRDEYRKANTGYSSGFIEKVWGSWSNFTEEAEKSLLVNRTDIVKTLKNKKDGISNWNFVFFHVFQGFVTSIYKDFL